MNNTKQNKPSWTIHIPMTVFTGATIALTILQHNAMAVYFAVLTFFAFAGSGISTYTADKEDKQK